VFDATGGIAVVDSAFLKKRCPWMIKPGKEKIGETMIQTTIHNKPLHYANQLSGE
jgi:hypothetical protein